ncbi:MAG: aldo/keto reductase, partial [Kiritimatiellia bacterium]
TGLDRRNIRTAIEGSLRRLQTDYVDLYQTHWADHDFPYEETLQVLTELVDEGKVRIIGSSNESPWGTMQAEHVAQTGGYCRYETIQNNYSIVNRRFEDALADICKRESISCLPYSPLGGGVCTGKYNGEAIPENARFSQYLKGEGERQKKMAHRFVNERSLQTVASLMTLAQDLSITVTQLSLAWCRQKDFVGSVIFGATSIEQLEENLKSADITLNEQTNERIDEISKAFPYPLG